MFKINKMILFSLVFLSLFACKQSKDCDTSYNSRQWENLPVPVQSDDVDFDLISQAIEIFNESIGAEGFIIDTNNSSEKFVFVSYADLPDGTHGESGYLVDENGYIDYSPLQIDVNLNDDEALDTLIHELGHSLGLGGHQEYGIMHCYDNGGNYDTAQDYYNAFELLREWFKENYLID